MKTQCYGSYLLSLILLLAFFYIPLLTGQYAYFDLRQWAWLGYGIDFTTLPWFNPLEGLGVPELASGGIGWNPIYYICHLLFSKQISYIVLILSHLIIFCWSVYSYAFLTKLRKTAALYMTVVLSLGGVLIGNDFDINRLLIFSYYPLSLIIMRYMLLRMRLEYIFYLSVVFALQFIGGDMRLAILSSISSGVVVLIDGYMHRQRMRKLVVSFVVALALALVFVAPKILFYFLYLDDSAVLILGKDLYFRYGVNLLAVISLWLPCFEPLFKGSGFYIGGASIFFMFCALASKKHSKLIKLHTISAISMFVVALGLFDCIHNIGDIIFCSSFSMAWLSSKGLQNLFDRGYLDRKFAIRASNMHFWFSATILLATLSFFMLVRLGYNAVRSVALMILQGQINVDTSRSTAYYQRQVDQWLDNLNQIMNFSNIWFVYALSSLLIFSLAVFVMRKRPKKGWVYTGIVLLTIIDLGIYRIMWNKNSLKTFKEIQGDVPLISGYVKSDFSRSIVFNASYSYLQKLRFSGVPTLNTNSISTPKSFAVLFKELGIVSLKPEMAGTFDKDVLSRFRQLLNFANVKYFIGLGDYMPNDFKRLDKLGGIGLYENQQAMGRLSLMKEYSVMPIAKQLRMLLEEPLELNKVVLLDRLPKQSAYLDYNDVQGVTDKLLIRNYTPTDILVDIVSSQVQILTLADQYSPGWVATVDGKAVELMRANYAFSAILVPAGPHRVKFQYKPEQAISALLGI